MNRPFSTRQLESLFIIIPKMLSGAAALGISVFAVRHLTPSVYGIFAFCVANLQLFDALVGSALDLSVLKLAPAYRKAGFPGITPPERGSVLLKLAVGAVLVPLIAALAPVLSVALFHSPDQKITLVALGCSLVGLLLFRSLQVHFQLDLLFRRYGASDLTQTTLRVGACIGLIWAGVSSPAVLISCYGLATVLTVLVFGSRLLRERQSSESWFQFENCRLVLRESLTLSLIAAFSMLVFNQDMFFVAAMRSTADLGILRASYVIAFIPELLGTYIGQAVLPRIVPYCEAGKFATFYRHFQLRAFVAGAAALILGMLLVGPVARTLFPPSYHGSLLLIRILLPAGIASLIGYPLTLNFLILYKCRVFLAIDAALAPFMAIGYYWTARHSGVAGVAAVTCAAKLIKFAITQWYGWRLAKRVDTPAAVVAQPA